MIRAATYARYSSAQQRDASIVALPTTGSG